MPVDELLHLLQPGEIRGDGAAKVKERVPMSSVAVHRSFVPKPSTLRDDPRRRRSRGGFSGSRSVSLFPFSYGWSSDPVLRSIQGVFRVTRKNRPAQRGPANQVSEARSLSEPQSPQLAPSIREESEERYVVERER